jgi:hypothetical protein
MRKFLVWCGVLALAAAHASAQARADAPAPKLVKENWDAAYLEGAKCGSFRTAVYEYDFGGGRKVVRTSLTMDLRIKRYNAVVPLRMDTTTDETPDGKVRGVSLTTYQDRGKLVLIGQVAGDELVLRVNGAEQKVPWEDDVIGTQKQDRLLKEKKAKPGDKLSFRNYEVSLLKPVTVRVVVKEPEEVDLFETKKGDKQRVERVRRKLLRAESVPDKVEVGGNVIQLPKLVSWHDKDYEAVRSEMELPGLGKVTLYRTTKAAAQEEGAAPALLPDLGLTNLITLDKPIEHVHDARSVTYRVTVKGDDDPAGAFARDPRQEARNVKGSSFELTVRASKPPAADDAEAPPPEPQLLKSSYFLDSDDEKVKEFASRATGRETDPWQKALKIERWVHENMHGSSSVGFASAGEVARTLTGDCRQHAMLTAAMCRAAGVPARTAVGLVYVDDADRGPVLGFHMWTEVWVKGRWHGLDATLGRGGVGPGHLKVGVASWNDTQTLAPLLPVSRVMGRLAVQVVRVEAGDGGK